MWCCVIVIAADYGRALFSVWKTADAVMAKFLSHMNGLVQDCSISTANALEILQSCTKPVIYMSDTNSSTIVPVDGLALQVIAPLVLLMVV